MALKLACRRGLEMPVRVYACLRRAHVAYGQAIAFHGRKLVGCDLPLLD